MCALLPFPHHSHIPHGLVNCTVIHTVMLNICVNFQRILTQFIISIPTTFCAITTLFVFLYSGMIKRNKPEMYIIHFADCNQSYVIMHQKHHYYEYYLTHWTHYWRINEKSGGWGQTLQKACEKISPCVSLLSIIVNYWTGQAKLWRGCE